MSKDTVRIEGLNDLLDDLERIEDPKRQAAVAKAGLRRGLNVVRDAMRRRAPRGKTGQLTKDIRTSVRQKAGVVSGKVGVIPKKRRKGQPKKKGPGSTAIARWIEYGTDAHRIPSLTVGRGKHKRLNKARVIIGGQVFSAVDHPGISPKPFLRPAVDTMQDQALEVAANSMHAFIEKELNK